MTRDERAWATGVWRRYCAGTVINERYVVMCRRLNNGDSCASRERPYTPLATPAEPRGPRAEERRAIDAWEAALPPVLRTTLAMRMQARRESGHAT